MNIGDIVKKIIRVLTSILMAALVIGALWQVFSRYVLNNPSLFTEEVLRFSLIWCSMLGAAYAFFDGKHLALVFIKEKLDADKKMRLEMFINLFTIAFATVVMVKGGFDLAKDNMQQLSPILKLPMGLVYGIIPLTGVLILGGVISNMAETLKSSKKEEAKKWQFKQQ